MSLRDAEQQVFLNDFNKLKAALVSFASKMLKNHGEFFPFARIIRADGTIATYSIAPNGERPNVSGVYEKLSKMVSAAARQGQFRAVGICSHVVHAVDNTSAIRLRLEYQNGAALEVMIQYQRDLSRAVLFANEVTNATAPTIFI